MIAAAGLLVASAWAGSPTVDVGLATELPTDVSLRVVGELPSRLRLGGSVGWMPGPYLDLVQGVAVGAGWYDESVATLIDAALHNALVFRVELGARPFADLGLYGDAGYLLAALGGGLAPPETVELAVGQAAEGEVQASATAHMLSLRLGYDLVVAESIVLGPTLGGVFTLGAGAQVNRAGGLGGRGSQGPAEEAAAELIAQMLRSYVHSPTLGLRVMWRL